MGRRSVYDMKLAEVYPLLAAKAMKKGRTREEVDSVIFWLKGRPMDKILR